MFGVKKTIYFVISGVLLGLSILVLVLMLCNVFNKDSIVVLSIIALFLLSICTFIQPYNKILKIVTEYRKKYFPVIVEGLSEYKLGFKEIIIKENSSGQFYIDFKKRVLFEGLNKVEAEYLLLKLIRDYVIMVYGVYENNKLSFKKTTIDEFIVTFKYFDDTIKNIKIAENGMINKK